MTITKQAAAAVTGEMSEDGELTFDAASGGTLSVVLSFEDGENCYAGVVEDCGGYTVTRMYFCSGDTLEIVVPVDGPRTLSACYSLARGASAQVLAGSSMTFTPQT
jgi:hypothetical protein